MYIKNSTFSSICDEIKYHINSSRLLNKKSGYENYETKPTTSFSWKDDSHVVILYISLKLYKNYLFTLMSLKR